MEIRRQSREGIERLTVDLLRARSHGLVTTMLTDSTSHDLWLELRDQGKALSNLAKANNLPAEVIQFADVNWSVGIDIAHIVRGGCAQHH